MQIDAGKWPGIIAGQHDVGTCTNDPQPGADGADDVRVFCDPAARRIPRVGIGVPGYLSLYRKFRQAFQINRMRFILPDFQS